MELARLRELSAVTWDSCGVGLSEQLRHCWLWMYFGTKAPVEANNILSKSFT